jgi:hypothetical protein
VTEDRDFKRKVRARARNTGESYQRSRRILRPDDAATPDKAQELEPLDVELTDEERRDVGWITQLALRIADGKPVHRGRPWTRELHDLHAAVAAAQDDAAKAGATVEEVRLARSLRGQFNGIVADAERDQPAVTDESLLADRIAGRLPVALGAVAECQALLDLNPRDPVAGQAHAVLSNIARQIARDQPS